jgi:glycosyltransferase involved in cell wall biosynthesis
MIYSILIIAARKRTPVVELQFKGHHALFLILVFIDFIIGPDLYFMMKISIITVVRNGAHTIRDCIESVLNQTYPVEYIIIDGCSTDGTLDIVKEYGSKISRVVSEPDKGIYDAMNKGIGLTTGDVVGILNADDFYINNQILAKIIDEFQTKSVDSVFADLVYVRPDNLNKIVRFYSGANFDLRIFAYGWMPPHPTFFVKRKIYEKYGSFRTDYKIAADFELLVRFLVKQRVSFSYLPEVLVKMRTGGASTRNLKSNWILNNEIIRACAENGIKTNLAKVMMKYFKKIFQLIDRPK